MTREELEEHKQKVREGEELLKTIELLDSQISDLTSSEGCLGIAYKAKDGSTCWVDGLIIDLCNTNFTVGIKQPIAAYLAKVQDYYIKKFDDM